MKSVIITIFIFLLSTLCSNGIAQNNPAPEATKVKYLIVRTDDVGMSHSVNMGLEKLLEKGYPVSVSVMFACPWYKESVKILEKYQNTSIGVHLTLNSEWDIYRWGPVIGSIAGKSLTDEDGYFFHSATALHQNNPDPDEVELELRAQIERAINTGLSIDYLDYHMGTAVSTPEFRKIVEKLAQEYEIALFNYYGEQSAGDGYYRARPDQKKETLINIVQQLQPGYNYLITHVGVDNEELGALKDMNSSHPLAAMSVNRQAELGALISDEFLEAVEANNVVLITHKELTSKTEINKAIKQN